MFRVKVMPDDGEPFIVTVTTRDISKWEKTTKGATFATFQADQKISDLYKITYYACVRQGLDTGTPQTLAEFESGADLDFLDDEDDEPDPTPSAVSPGATSR